MRTILKNYFSIICKNLTGRFRSNQILSFRQDTPVEVSSLDPMASANQMNFIWTVFLKDYTTLLIWSNQAAQDIIIWGS